MLQPHLYVIMFGHFHGFDWCRVVNRGDELSSKTIKLVKGSMFTCEVCPYDMAEKGSLRANNESIDTLVIWLLKCRFQVN